MQIKLIMFKETFIATWIPSKRDGAQYMLCYKNHSLFSSVELGVDTAIFKADVLAQIELL